MFFKKTIISYPLTRRRTCGYSGVRNTRFLKTLCALFSCYLRFEIRFYALLPIIDLLLKKYTAQFWSINKLTSFEVLIHFYMWKKVLHLFMENNKDYKIAPFQNFGALFLFVSMLFDTTQNFYVRKHWSEKGKSKTDNKEIKVIQYWW